MAPGPRKDISQGASLSNANPSLRDATAWWLADLWFGNDREGVAKAHKFVDVLEQTPYGLATFLDDLGSQIGRGDIPSAATTAAIGILPGKTPAIHISPYEFDKFNYKLGRGKGEGTANEGEGLYFMSPGNPMEYSYANQFERVGLRHKHLNVLEDYHSALNEIENYAADMTSGNANDMATIALGKIMHPNSSYSQTYIPDDVEDYAKSLYERVKTGPHKYEVELGIDPSQTIELGKGLMEQPKSQQAALYDLIDSLYKPENATVHQGKVRGAYGPDEYHTAFVWDKHLDSADTYQPPSIGAYGLSQLEADRNAMRRIDEYLKEVGDKPLSSVANFYRSKAPDEYSKRGISALKYTDPDSFYQDPNYVVWNDDLIKILKRSALAVPGLLGLINAMEEDNGQQIR